MASVVNISCDELRLAQRPRGGGTQPSAPRSPAACQGTGEGGITPSPPARRRSRLADRHRLLRLPRRRRQLRPRPASATPSPAHPTLRAIEIKISQGAKPGLGGLLPAAKITKEIAETARHPDGRRLREPGVAHRVPRRRLACSTSSSCSRARPACPSASSRRSVTSTLFRELARLMGRGDRGHRLPHHRRRRGRHRRRAAVVRRPRRAAVQGRVLARVPHLRRARRHRPARVPRRRTPRAPPPRAAGVRDGLRRRERRPRGDAVDRVHPGPALPHRTTARPA